RSHTRGCHRPPSILFRETHESMTQPLQTIVALQDALRRLAQGEARLSGIPDWMQELHAQHASRSAEIAPLEAQAEAAAKDRRTAEHQIEDAQERLKHYQQQISL